jgi:hypothetical protein
VKKSRLRARVRLLRIRWHKWRENMKNPYYRHRLGIKVRIGLATVEWFGIVVMMEWFGARPFLGALVQALLVTSMLCGALALHSPPLADPEGPNVFANRMWGLASLALGLGTILAVVLAIMVVLLLMR